MSNVNKKYMKPHDMVSYDINLLTPLLMEIIDLSILSSVKLTGHLSHSLIKVCRLGNSGNGSIYIFSFPFMHCTLHYHDSVKNIVLIVLFVNDLDSREQI